MKRVILGSLMVVVLATTVWAQAGAPAAEPKAATDDPKYVIGPDDRA